jgi:DNA polymerase I-like protein with 3'-5' exonuclease and polymerase domains
VKLDVVKEEYWDKGLDTDEVPYDILCEYLVQDLETTESVFYKLSEMLANSSYEMQKLVKMSNLDLIVLQDIERNGLLVNIDKCIKEGDSIAEELEIIDSKFKTMAGHEWFNTNSGEHLSALLYGGVITHVEKVPYTFHYKDGRTAEKLRNQEVEYTFKGFFKPLEGSELEKEGFYSTGQPTLVALAEKAKEPYKSILNLLLHRAKIEKRRSTYYHGYPKNIDTYGWTDNILHTSYNQCVAETGRLSSTKPNVQNIEDKVKEVFVTRFK